MSTRTARGAQGAVESRAAAAGGGLRILVADEDHAALARTAEMLESLGHQVTSTAVNLVEATDAIAREDPDASVVLVHNDDEHALDLIEEITSYSRGPVIALLREEDAAFLRRAAERGVAAYDRGLGPEGIQAALEVALHRHAERHRLRQKVEQLEHALDRRAVIERAKGILMERHGLDERGSFDRLRSHARSTNQAVVDVARAVTNGHALLPGARD